MPFFFHVTDLETTFLAALTTAAWPLGTQVMFTAAFLLAYWLWSRYPFAGVDRAARLWLGRRLGVSVVWVPRNTVEYQTPFHYRGRYRRWSWGIAAEGDRTFVADGVVATASLLIVNVVAGALPVGLLLYIALWLRALSYVVFLPACVAAVAIYSVYWSGHYHVAWMRREGDVR